MLNYEKHCKPKLARMLRALSLDVTYERASGMEMHTAEGRTVVDFVGGFGALLLGHNPEPVRRALIASLERQEVVHCQVAISAPCGELAAKLNQHMATQRDYVVNFSSTGAESAEAAIKHAYKRYAAAIEKKFMGAGRAADELLREMAKTESLTPAARSAIEAMQAHNREVKQRLLRSPAILGLHGSFHGKLTSSLKVTFNPGFREDFAELSSLRSIFLQHRDVHRLGEIVAAEGAALQCPVRRGDEVAVHPVQVNGVMALILEVIQGEGGVHEVSCADLQALADAHGRVGVPYIIDEVQTGCGRLGSIYGHKLTPLSAIEPEYVLLSKALGGGIAKIGATLIRSDVYDPDFGIQHTSTFGEDALAARVALATLEVLEADGCRVLREVGQRGAELKEALHRLAHDYPGIVKEVRGRGLMLGIELHRLAQSSPFLRAASESGALPLLIASYALRYHDLRLFCSLNSLLAHGSISTTSVIRVQPSYLVTTTQIERLVRCLREVFEIISCNNEFALLSHLVGLDASADQRQRPERFTAVHPRGNDSRAPDVLSAFIAHATSVDKLIETFLPSFAAMGVDPKKVAAWWDDVCEFIEPTLVRSEYIRASGRLVRTDIILIPHLPAYIERLKAQGRSDSVREKVDDAVEMAQNIAASESLTLASVGLGAYTSIVSNNGEALRVKGVPVTTGNAFTTALVVEGIRRLVEQRGMCWPTLSIGIVGAAGNIGSVLSEIYSQRCPRLTLIGRASRDSLRRVELVRRGCVRALLARARSGSAGSDGLVVGELRKLLELGREDPGLQSLRSGLAEVAAGRILGAQLTEDILGMLAAREVLRIDVSMELSDVAHMDIVIVSTDSPDRELVKPGMLKPGAIVCCASVPTNISLEFIGNPNFIAFDGGLARVPDNTTIQYPGFPAGGLTFGCHSESIIAALEPQVGFRSVGAITAADVTASWKLGRKHGFDLGRLRLHDEEIEGFAI